MEHPYEPKVAEALLRNRLKWEEKLEVLLHLDQCSLCWNRVYEMRRSMDSQFFRSPKPKRSRKQSTQSEQSTLEVGSPPLIAGSGR